MKKRKIACWDFDEMLGTFAGFPHLLRHESIPEFIFVTPGMRYGMKEALEALKDYDHVVTTSTSLNEESVQQILNAGGIAHCFADITRVVQGTTRFGKCYLPVARKFGLSEEEARARMIAIGNLPGDQPIDLEGMVFIHQHQAHKYDAAVIRIILEQLNAVGDGNFAQAFERLWQGAISTQGRVDLGERIAAKLEYRTDSFIAPVIAGGAPTIGDIEAESYSRPVVPFVID